MEPLLISLLHWGLELISFSKVALLYNRVCQVLQQGGKPSKGKMAKLC